ncbi:ABC transporter permease subunit [Kocuria koreensis]|jgi:osmoprotectant transport system permease protein|uniref:ABC transporter permease subunit n=1 Tax=Rothia koreensis TaxID=592378 RepID=A0A7K1LL54_9MICC|nr:ABC transporter permease [Rothia koreensis]MUN55783.1 ABC transporter permease subunit [Rothia koreensis]
MNVVEQTWNWFTDPASWGGSGGIWIRLAEHLGYTGMVLGISVVVAVPIGLWLGHTRRGGNVVIGLTGALRSLPTLGLLTLFALWIGIGLTAPVLALVILAVAPLLANAYAGVAAVDPAVVDAARAQGMKEWQILFTVEIPNAVPVLFGGIRNAALQIVATVTVMAYIDLGGLGRFLIDGLAVRDYSRMVASMLLAAVLALALDGILALVQRMLTSPGLVKEES